MSTVMCCVSDLDEYVQITAVISDHGPKSSPTKIEKD